MADPRKVRADANALVGELLERLARAEVRELEIRRGGVRVRVSKDGGPLAAASSAAAAPAMGSAAAVGGAAPATDRGEAPTVSAPLTGVFYRSPSPQAQPYVQVGSEVGVGQVIGLIEAMKLFNEIRSTATGRVRRILAENGQLVRAHQALIELEPA
jgi:acetyl-CoA carboxylase biotin carboxyl carrier protein